MRVLIRKKGHRCCGLYGQAVRAYEGENLRQEFKDMMKVTLENHPSIKSITIDKQYLFTL
jgi:hypothetical protein